MRIRFAIGSIIPHRAPDLFRHAGPVRGGWFRRKVMHLSAALAGTGLIV
jgi:hypothetical protein